MNSGVFVGLEPSDDEDEELPQLPISSSFHNLLAEQDPLLQTYLLKKQLRLERQTLIREVSSTVFFLSDHSVRLVIQMKYCLE